MESSTQYKNRWYVLFIMCMVLFIISIDNTVLNLALPSISTDLGASASQLQWIVDAYTLVFASLLITTGSVGDRYGRKKLLMLGLALFGLGSLGAALSVSTFMLIVFRGVLGLAGSMVMPSTLSILTSVFQDGKERAKAIAIWSSIFSIGAGIGPVIGGFLINSFSLLVGGFLPEYPYRGHCPSGWISGCAGIKRLQSTQTGPSRSGTFNHWRVLPGLWNHSGR